MPDEVQQSATRNAHRARRWPTVAVIVGIVLLALVPRVLSCFVPLFMDESTTTIKNITEFFRNRNIIPFDYTYPHLYSYMSAVVLGIWSLILVAAGKAHSLAGAGLLFITGDAPLLEPLRFLTVAFDLATVAIIYFLGRRLRGPATGIIGALFVALSFSHVRYARWALPDVPMACFVTLSLLFALKIAEDSRTSCYILAGMFAGLGASATHDVTGVRRDRGSHADGPPGTRGNRLVVGCEVPDLR